MKKEWIKVGEEEVCLKKSRFGWRIIHPIKNKDGTTNWKNLLIGGSWGNIIKIGLIVGIILFIAYSYKTDMANCIEFARENYCNLKI